MGDPVYAAVRALDQTEVERLLAAGANPRLGDGTETPLHAAARTGPAALVEALIVGGAVEWTVDADGRLPLDVARTSDAPEREAIVALLDRGRIDDPAMRAAVAALHAGDAAELARLLDAEPRLTRERILAPEPYRRAARKGYFDDRALLWYVANNPTAVARMPENVVELARLIVARGVDQDDLDATLALTVSSAAAREEGRQTPLVHALLEAGAVARRETILVAAAHGECDALRALVAAGVPCDAPIAAALGDDAALRAALADAGPDDVQDAFGLAVINGRHAAVRSTLAAGADVHRPLPVHGHATALHEAALLDDVTLIDLLLAHGADRERRDTLWDATPLGWAIHEGKHAARAALER